VTTIVAAPVHDN